jgi:hypothetical protein
MCEDCCPTCGRMYGDEPADEILTEEEQVIERRRAARKALMESPYGRAAHPDNPLFSRLDPENGRAGLWAQQGLPKGHPEKS